MGFLSKWFNDKPKYRILTTVDGEIIPQVLYSGYWMGISKDNNTWMAISNQLQYCGCFTSYDAKAIIEAYKKYKKPTETYEYIY